MTFRKDDDDKPDFTLLPYAALEEAARVMAFGEDKYDRDNWRKGTVDRYVAAALRHLFAHSDPDYLDVDFESGYDHLSHALCCVIFAVSIKKGMHDEERFRDAVRSSSDEGVV